MLVIRSPLSGFLALWSSHCRAKNRPDRDDSADPDYHNLLFSVARESIVMIKGLWGRFPWNTDRSFVRAMPEIPSRSCRCSTLHTRECRRRQKSFFKVKPNALLKHETYKNYMKPKKCLTCMRLGLGKGLRGQTTPLGLSARSVLLLLAETGTARVEFIRKEVR